MTLKRFKDDDIYHNVIVAHPDIEFFVHNGKVYYNRETEQTGNFSNKVNHVPQGYISLYEQNIDRPSDSLISRFITKDGTRGAYRTISTVSFQNFEFAFYLFFLFLIFLNLKFYRSLLILVLNTYTG